MLAFLFQLVPWFFSSDASPWIQSYLYPTMVISAPLRQGLKPVTTVLAAPIRK
jgi:hypothetical protein